MTSIDHNQNTEQAPGGTDPAVLFKLIFALVLSLVLASCGGALVALGEAVELETSARCAAG